MRQLLLNQLIIILSACVLSSCIAHSSNPSAKLETENKIPISKLNILVEQEISPGVFEYCNLLENFNPKRNARTAIYLNSIKSVDIPKISKFFKNCYVTKIGLTKPGNLEKLLPVIAKSFPHVQELTLKQLTKMNWSHLGNFANLKVLKISYCKNLSFDKKIYCARIELLEISDTNIAPQFKLQDLASLYELRLDNPKHLRFFPASQVPILHHLSVSQPRQKTDLHDKTFLLNILDYKKLNSLELGLIDKFADLYPMTKIKSLSVKSNASDVIVDLKKFPNLEIFKCEGHIKSLKNFSAVRKLKLLSLKGNLVCPDSDFAQIYKLSNLLILKIENAVNLKSLSFFKNLSKLKSISLKNNSSLSDFSEIRWATELKELKLATYYDIKKDLKSIFKSNKEIEFIVLKVGSITNKNLSLEHLSNIKDITLYLNNSKQLEALKNLPKQKLTKMKLIISDIAPEITGNFPSLEELTINAICNNAKLENFVAPKLKSLSLSSFRRVNNFNFSQLKTYPDLEKINVRNYNISNILDQNYDNLKSLIFPDIKSKVHSSKISKRELESAFPKLEYLGRV